MKKIDMLEAMWEQQREFMDLLVEKGKFPKYPVDITSKEGQKLLKDISHDCADELHEARAHLRNSKSHRSTEVKEIDREAYIVEIVDSLHYFFEIAIASGISIDELFNAYIAKGKINVLRLQSGY